MSSKLKKDALATIKTIESCNTRSYAEECAVLQARRVLLLERAYRYQRAVDCLTSWIVWHIGQTGTIMGDKQMACKQKAKNYRSKAAALYKQAEEV